MILQEVKILSPTYGGLVGGDVEVTALVSGVDSSLVDHVTLYVGDDEKGNMDSMGDGMYRHVWDSDKLMPLPKYDNEYRLLEVRVSLKSGESDSAHINIDLFNVAPIIIGFATLIVAQVLVYLMNLGLIKLAKIVSKEPRRTRNACLLQPSAVTEVNGLGFWQSRAVQ